jgi:hypothetical protein
MISSMLGAILEMLPVGAIWLGVTRLTAAWNISDLDFRAFSDEMHSRSQKGGLTVLRLYRLSEKPDDELRAALQLKLTTSPYFGDRQLNRQLRGPGFAISCYPVTPLPRS